MKQGFDTEAFFELHRYLIDLLQSLRGGSVIPVIVGPWTSVAASQAIVPGQQKLAVNTTAAPVTLTIPASLKVQGTLIVTSGAGGANPYIVVAPAGTTIWDPSTAAFAASAQISNGTSGGAWWQLDLPNNRWVEAV